MLTLSAGGVREAFGVFRAPRVNLDALDLPTGLQQVALAQRATKSFSERQADSLEDVVEILRDSLQALLIIADNTSSAPSEFTEAEGDIVIANILDNINDRQIQAAA